MIEVADSDESPRQKMRDLYAEMQANGMTEYGSYIPAKFVHKVLGITVPLMASRDVFNKLALFEVAAIDYCRNALLNEGKYLSGTNGGYRILLPSENAGQIDAYMTGADRKLSRALKLSRNTPKATGLPDQMEARILMKKTGIRRGFDSGAGDAMAA